MNISLLWLEKKYVDYVSSRLPLFKRKGGNRYLTNFRCVICGDSEKNKRKARAYIGERDGKLFYYCHNCNASMSFQYFLSLHDDVLYRNFVKEKFINDSDVTTPTKIVSEPSVSYLEKFYGVDSSGPLMHLQKLSQMTWTHPVKRYVHERKIPLDYHQKLRYVPLFNKFVNSLLPHMELNEKKDHGRLIIPFLDKNGKCFGFQGRAFTDTELRYVTIMLSDRMPKIFGLDTVDLNKKVYALEGPLDSMFIPNAIAAAGSDFANIEAKDIVYVLDNEPRNKTIVDKLEKLIKEKKSVCIWPTDIHEKDINDMILYTNKSPLDIKKIIDDNTFSGLMASLEFQKWKKI